MAAALTALAVITQLPSAAAITATTVLGAVTPTHNAQVDQHSHSAPAVQASTAIVPGFNSLTYGPNDDGSYPCTGMGAAVPANCTPTPVTLPFPIDYYGTVYTSVYINNNGNLTMGQPLSQFTPQSLNQISAPMIAPFWADVDTRTGPVVTYGYGTVDGHTAFGVNWLGVGCYNENTSVANYFQVLLINRSDLGQNDFDIEFNYGPITWDSGEASGGNGQCLDGTAARAGYTSGFGDSYELPGSGVDGGFLSSNSETGLSGHSMGSTQTGRYVFGFRNGGYPLGPGYVAMGDSYSSGYGTGIPQTDPLDTPYFNEAGNPCDRTTQAWPMLMSDEYAAAPELFANNALATGPLWLGSPNNAFIACSGETSEQLLNGESSKERPSQIRQLANYEVAHGDPGLVTVTIGGDDLGFTDVITDCFLSIVGTPISCIGELHDEISYLESGAFTSTLETTYKDIKTQAGDAEVVAVGYPFLFPTASLSHENAANARCPWLAGDAYQALPQFENAQLDLDQVMREAASEAGIRFVALDDVFAGHELCTGDAYINSITQPWFLGAQPGHPNEAGQQAIAQAVAGQLGFLPGTGGQSVSATTAAVASFRTSGPALRTDSLGRVADGNVGRHELGARAVSASTSHSSAADASATSLTVSSGLTSGELSVPYTGFVWASGGVGPYSWAVTSGALPDGLSLDPGTGIISGTPTTTGTSDFTVTATDSSNPPLTASADLSVDIDPIPVLAVQTTALPQPTVAQSYSFPISATGGLAPYTWSVTSGTLPAGLNLDTSTGVIEGTPTTSGSQTFTLTATDSSVTALTASATFTLNVVAAGSPLTVAVPVLGSGAQGGGYDGELTSTGGTAPVYWSVTSGALPDGLTLDPGTGQISGVATGSGTYQFTAQVEDAAGNLQSEQLSITIAPGVPLVLQSGTSPDGQVGVSYEDVLDAESGVAPYNFSVSSGDLPDGLSLDPSSGVISGTPTTAGTYDFEVSVTDSATPDAGSATQDFSIVIDPAPTAPAMTVSDTVTATTVGTPYNTSVIPDGGTGPYSFQISSGALPPGLTLDSSSGTISGTTTSTGTYSATVLVTDSSSPTAQTASDNVSIEVSQPAPLAVSTSVLDDADVGSPYADPIDITGGTAPYTFSVTSGFLPDGLSLDPNAGIITGTATGTGEASFTVTVTDDASPTPQTASADLTLNVDPEQSLSLAPLSLPDAAQGIAYSQVVAASGGIAPYSFSITDGSLPDGLNLGSTSGVISGTPTGSGQASFTVGVMDSSSPQSQSATEAVTLNVDPSFPLTVTTTALDSATEGAAYSATLDSAGGTSPDTWSVVNGTLPAGLTLDPVAGIISGTPSGYGTSYFTVQATDSSTPTAVTTPAPLSLEVVPLPPSSPPSPPSSPPSPPSSPLTAQTISFTAPASGSVGGSAILSATGGTSGNPVVFTVDISSGAKVCYVSGTNGTTVNYTAAGSCVIDANQAGNANYAAAPQVELSITVRAATTATTSTTATTLSFTTPLTYGAEASASFHVTVTTTSVMPIGTVAVKNGPTTLCTITLASGAGSCKPLLARELSTGTYYLVATYGGSANFKGSTSAKETLTVAKATTKTALKLLTRKVIYGHEQVEHVSVTISIQYPGMAATGTVTIKASARTLCVIKLKSDKGSCTLSAKKLKPGTYRLVATYGGSTNLKGSTSTKETLTIAKS